jgi:hypothetical protein
MPFTLQYALILSRTHTISHRDRAGSRQNSDFTCAEKHSERRILYPRDACKFNTMKHVNGEALPELDAIVLLEG